MLPKQLNAGIIVTPDGRIYEGAETDVGTHDISPHTNRYLGSYHTEPRTFEGQTVPSDSVRPRMEKPNVVTPLRNTMSSISSYTGEPKALTAAPEGQANSENIAHLQLIRLFPQAQGAPERYFFLDEAFVRRDIPKLEYREPFYDVVQTAQYLQRLEQSRAVKTPYDEIKFDLDKLVDKVYTPIEDIYRTIINPQMIDLEQIRWGMERKRNYSALAAIKQIGNEPAASDLGGASNKIDLALPASGSFHSTISAADKFNDVFVDFLQANQVYITHTIWNPKAFARYTENTFVRAQGPLGLNPIRLGGGGVTDMPGIQGVKAIVDPAVPTDKVYAINKPNALRLGEGPKITRRYYDEERDASAIKILDFHQYLAVKPQLTKISRNFGITLNIDNGTA